MVFCLSTSTGTIFLGCLSLKGCLFRLSFKKFKEKRSRFSKCFSGPGSRWPNKPLQRTFNGPHDVDQKHQALKRGLLRKMLRNWKGLCVRFEREAVFNFSNLKINTKIVKWTEHCKGNQWLLTAISGSSGRRNIASLWPEDYPACNTKYWHPRPWVGRLVTGGRQAVTDCRPLCA